jgi:hypothetical protein
MGVGGIRKFREAGETLEWDRRDSFDREKEEKGEEGKDFREY